MTYNENINTSRKNWICIFVILFISIAVFKILMRIHEEHFDLLYRAAYGVLEGKPHWIAYQNRLLGPFIVLLISKIGVSYLDALRIFILLMIVLQNFLLFFLLRKINIQGKNALVTVSIYSFAFLLVQHDWFYTWDSIDAIIFTLFAFGIVNAKPTYYFVLLYCIELLNRESALFIALYLIVDSFNLRGFKNKSILASKGKLLIGNLLMLAGIIYTETIRNYLYIGPVDHATNLSHELIGNHINFVSNLQDLFYYNLFSENIINTAFLLGSIAYIYYSTRLHIDAQTKGLLVYCVIMVNTIIFGLVNETRVYIVLLPFLIFLPIQVEKNHN